jgi:hypothetical protein
MPVIVGLSNTLQKITRGWAIFVLFIMDAAFMGLILPMVQGLMKMDGGSPGALDLQFFYTPAAAYDRIAAYGDYGRGFYRSVELTVDIIYPIVYTLFFAMLITWLFQRGFARNSPIQRLNVVPLGAWLFDLLENLGIVAMLSVYPARPAVLAWLSTAFTMIKWLFAGASMLLLLLGLVAAARNRFRKEAALAG